MVMSKFRTRVFIASLAMTFGCWIISACTNSSSKFPQACAVSSDCSDRNDQCVFSLSSNLCGIASTGTCVPPWDAASCVQQTVCTCERQAVTVCVQEGSSATQAMSAGACDAGSSGADAAPSSDAGDGGA
jgi:hypothetical protein